MERFDVAFSAGIVGRNEVGTDTHPQEFRATGLLMGEQVRAYAVSALSAVDMRSAICYTSLNNSCHSPAGVFCVTHNGNSVTVFVDAMREKIPFTLKWDSEKGFSSGPTPRTF
jgi:hypothetical protein